MKNKKIIIYVVATLIVVFVALAILGVFSKHNNEDTDTPNTSNVTNKAMNVISGENKVKYFNTLIDQQEFIKANKTTTDGVFEATYEDKLVVKFIDSEGTNDIVKEVPEITNVKALSGFTDKEARLRLYILTEEGDFYLLEWSKSTNLKITKYNIPNIDSYIAIYGDLDGSQTQLFVIAKTTDGQYYSE